MKFKHSFKNYAILCGVLVAVLLGIYGVLVLTSTSKNAPPKPITVSSTVNCSFPDKTFCSTDQLMRGYVSSKDFSDILENQLPTNVTCSTNTKTKPYCKNIRYGTVVQLYQIGNGDPSGPQLYTRNDYIAFFRSYFQQYGPFSFTSEKTVGPTVQMQYADTNHAAQYTLAFIKQGSAWKFAYPTVAH